jgi:hypothetical protein
VTAALMKEERLPPSTVILMVTPSVIRQTQSKPAQLLLGMYQTIPTAMIVILLFIQVPLNSVTTWTTTATAALMKE